VRDRLPRVEDGLVRRWEVADVDGLVPFGLGALNLMDMRGPAEDTECGGSIFSPLFREDKGERGGRDEVDGWGLEVDDVCKGDRKK